MYKIISILLFLIYSTLSYNQTLISWNFSGQPGDQTSQNSSFSAIGIGTGVLMRGAGLGVENAMNTINSKGWFESTDDLDDVNEQISEEDYYEWTLPINSGYNVVISSVNYTTSSSGTGPTGWELRSNIDGFFSAYSPNMDKLSGTITFRLYGIRSTSGGGSAGTGRISAISISGNAALPVTFKNINIEIIHNKGILAFSTASETNNDYFTIERSGDGSDFDAIGEIDGAGNSSEERHYEFTDRNPLPGFNYYRIKQTDFDGKYSYSEIRSVRHYGAGNIVVSPRNTDGRLDIRTEMDSYEVAIYSSAGQEVSRFSALSGHQSVGIESLQSGIYFVKVVSGATSETVKIVKY